MVEQVVWQGVKVEVMAQLPSNDGPIWCPELTFRLSSGPHQTIRSQNDTQHNLSEKKSHTMHSNGTGSFVNVYICNSVNIMQFLKGYGVTP